MSIFDYHDENDGAFARRVRVLCKAMHDQNVEYITYQAQFSSDRADERYTNAPIFAYVQAGVSMGEAAKWIFDKVIEYSYGDMNNESVDTPSLAILVISQSGLLDFHEHNPEVGAQGLLRQWTEQVPGR